MPQYYCFHLISLSFCLLVSYCFRPTVSSTLSEGQTYVAPEGMNCAVQIVPHLTLSERLLPKVQKWKLLDIKNPELYCFHQGSKKLMIAQIQTSRVSDFLTSVLLAQEHCNFDPGKCIQTSKKSCFYLSSQMQTAHCRLGVKYRIQTGLNM